MSFRSLSVLIVCSCVIATSTPAQTILHPEMGEPVRLTQKLNEDPGIPSPYTAPDGTETVTILGKDGTWAVIPVTVESGEPYCPHCQSWGKGNQLFIDGGDFPTLKSEGLHSESHLDSKETITGRTLEVINFTARPNRFSGEGFIAEDEDIISVLKGDDRSVRAIGLTHPRLAYVLFHIWNTVRDTWRNIDQINYNGNMIHVFGEGDKGYQESIFHDEITGHWRMEIRRDLKPEEKQFLMQKYAHLSYDQMAELMEKLTYIHTGEMVAYYIMRYGFYEGHTGYRADPIAMAYIFGLRSLEEIETAFPGKLYKALTEHHATGG